ncbi:hypothetical protein BKA66DRAFT_452181 [Pyrenochaeta sp. MPI-SDFR-AT-0127]|nr:hypothetical protein BKA66DRAFT_452181 [Pyrenochaeta sp. MPI-SDFR-AT-0127]
MNERREHLPSPVKHHILWSSPLKGMERPVRSFKSFLRTIPPNPTLETHKPLPPTPTTPKDLITNPLSGAPPSLLERKSSTTSWKAPEEWEWDNPSPPSQPFQTTSLFPARNFSPLLPEPSPRFLDMNASEEPWPFQSCDSQQPRLQPIQEGINDWPDPPPRNPSRCSPFRTPSVESDSAIPWSSIGDNSWSHSPTIEDTKSYSEDFSKLRPQTALPQSSGLNQHVSSVSTKAKAFESLGIGSPRQPRTVWEDWSDGLSSPQDEDGISEDMMLRRKRHRPLNRESPMEENNMEMMELTDKLRKLSFAQDYHNVLADQYHDSHIQPQERQAPLPPQALGVKRIDSAQRSMPSENHELIPPPLTWRKSDSLSQASPTPSQQQHAFSGSELKKKQHKGLISWIPIHHRNDAHKRHGIKKVITKQRQEHTTQDNSRMNIHFPKVLTHTPGFKFNKGRMKVAEVARSNKTSRSPWHPPSSSAPLEQSTPLIWLPGGFAIIRRSPSDTPQPQITRPYDGPPLSNTPQQDSNAGSHVSFSDNSQRRSSLYSLYSQSSGASRMSVGPRLRNSIGSPPSLHSRSTASSRPTSLLAQEIFQPRTPPPLPPKKHRDSISVSASSPLSSEMERRFGDLPDEGDKEHDTHMHRFLDKAKGARNAWRRHQREAKHEKLKRSIKVLGPTDPGVSAAYVKPETKRLGQEDDVWGRMSRSMGPESL